MLTEAFEGYSQSLRILLEAVLRSSELLLVDAHEAAGNIEQGLTNVLNAFHSVYDSAREDSRIQFDWYGTPETAAILAMRNARHHNLANRIRGLYTFHLQQPLPENLRSYILVDYPPTPDGGDTFDAPISWLDLRHMLSMPASQSRLAKATAQAIMSYLAHEKLDALAPAHKVDASAIFINSTPLIVNATRKFVPPIKQFVRARSLEARFYLDHFETVLPANTDELVVDQVNIFLPA